MLADAPLDGGEVLMGRAAQSTAPGILGAVLVAAACALTAGLLVPLSAGGAWAGQGSLSSQSPEEVARKSDGCLSCHVYETPDAASMHATPVNAGCSDCHGGNAAIAVPTGATPGSGAFEDARRAAHVAPQLGIWTTSANPENTFASTLEESADFIRFVNPGDLRVVDSTCGQCHLPQTYAVQKSLMRNAAMLWAAALYNNGAFPFKDARFGEFYMPDGAPATAYTNPEPTPEETRLRGILPYLQPLPRWELSQPGNVLRVFERGGARPLEVGVPEVTEEPGRPRNRLSNRGPGTGNRTDPVFIGLQKTRLQDPTLNFMGTNDVAGDFRSGGCTACHVVYANDRSPVHAAQYAASGNEGESGTSDPMIPKGESGHPIRHVMTTGIPTSQCMSCHIHPGANALFTYLGMTWWDNETDGEHMYPAGGADRSLAARAAIERRNPEGSALRGLWADPDFLQQTGTQAFNAQLDQTVLADFHGHGWLYRAVFKRDRKGNLLDAPGNVIDDVTPEMLWQATQNPSLEVSREGLPAGQPVHLKDIHLERGMHCVDCHFSRDVHGDGNLYGEPRTMIEVACRDCHGTIGERATFVTSGPGAPPGGTNLIDRYPGRFQLRGRARIQRSAVGDTQWEIPQIMDSLSSESADYNERSAYAHSIRKDGVSWGSAVPPEDLAHADSTITCQTCHTSWVTSCFGCHLSQRANEKTPMLHNEGTSTRNWTQYNYQVLRDDIFMLGKDGSTVGGTVSPVRSSSAVVVSSQDTNRQWIYYQQQTVSAEGFAGQAFNTHVPHTVRTTETKTCTDCHLSAAGDNNAIMAQLLLLGTRLTNFMGRFVFVGTGEGGVVAVAVTEMEEPQAVIGSDLHRIAYPREYAAHLARDRRLTSAVRHGSSNALDVQFRGEYVYIADGAGGFKVYDAAQLNQKGFSERIVSAPVSPLGQDTRVASRYATAVAAPSTLAVDPARLQLPANEEQPIHPLYGYIYVTDREEGLVVATAATLLDGNPGNNFLQRAATFNPDGLLDGAVNLAIAGSWAYVLCDRGLVVVDLDDPLQPRVAARIDAPAIRQPRAVAVQFRYAFVTDADGLKVIDVTFPEQPRLVDAATVPLADARGLWVARTYAYVAAGAQGLVIVDVEKPEQPLVDQTFDAGGALDDARDVKVAMTNASVFAYVADGRNGLRVLQLVSANSTAGAFGFSPRPAPELIATYRTDEPALSISEGLDRDRAVDESGNQLAVFGRRGGRPFTLAEMQRLYLRDGVAWTTADRPPRR